MKFNIGGSFIIEQWRKNALISKRRIKNGITNEGLNTLLYIGFQQGGTPSWYIGLIDGTTPPSLSPSDTMATHPGWTENVDYDETERPEWETVGSGVGKIISTTFPPFTMNADSSIAGAFIVSNNTKGGSVGDLWSTGLFNNGSGTYLIGDVCKVYYELTAVGS